MTSNSLNNIFDNFYFNVVFPVYQCYGLDNDMAADIPIYFYEEVSSYLAGYSTMFRVKNLISNEKEFVMHITLWIVLRCINFGGLPDPNILHDYINTLKYMNVTY